MMKMKKKTRKRLASVLTAAMMLNSVAAFSPLMTSAALPFTLSCSKDEFMVGDDGTVTFYCYNAYAKGDECEIALIDDNVDADVAIDVNGNVLDYFIADYMYDDGDPEHGDRQANDGIYSCKIQIVTSYPGVYSYHAKNMTSDSDMIMTTTEPISIRILNEFTEEDKKIMQEVDQKLDDFCKKCYAEGISGYEYYNAMCEFLEQLQNEGLIKSFAPRGYFDDINTGITFYYHTGKKGKTPPEIICVIPTEPLPTDEPMPTNPTEPEPVPTESSENTSENQELQEGMVYFSGIYQYRKNDTGITITACDRNVTGKLEVPEQIDGHTVTAIGEHAFYLCATATEIRLPDTVKSVGKQAFTYCYALEYVNIPDGVPAIEDETFLMCKALKTVDIPESVTSIGVRAFTECEALDDIKLPSGVTSLGTEVFQKCVALEWINIPDGVTEIPDNAFLGCTSLKNMELPQKTERIGKMAFMLCNLEYIKIPNPNCEIDETFATTTGSRDTKFFGFSGSTAQAFAEQYGYPFTPLDDVPPTESVNPSEDPSETTEPSEPIETTEPVEFLYGDATQDGELDIADVVLMNRCYVGVEKLTEIQIKAADTDGDGKISLTDSMNVLRKLVHLIDIFPIEEQIEVPMDPDPLEPPIAPPVDDPLSTIPQPQA
ncbi:MAG: leucine-rich repeat protein [Oscillospiraceae bacterium]|nr:leucine-rich repeat protein [Oscillospiraceae bacterium]